MLVKEVRSRRVLLMAESYPPVLNSAGRLFSELAESLAASGFDVVVLTDRPSRYLPEAADNCLENSQEASASKVKVVRLPAFASLRKVLLLRYGEQFLKMIAYGLAGLWWGWRRDVVVYSPPLPLAVSGITAARFWRRRCVVNVQDLYPLTAVLLGAMSRGRMWRICEVLERWVYRHADAITVHSEGNRRYVVDRAGEGLADRVHVVHNWIDLEKYRPGPLNNGFRERHGLQDRFVVSYAGVLGLAQTVEGLLHAARQLREDPEVLFVIAGDGEGYRHMQRCAQTEGLNNIRFMKPLPEPEYIRLLQSSDVCFVTLSGRLQTPAIPGKLQSIMAVGRPVVCEVPAVSGARAIVEEAGCGVWVDPREQGSALRAIEQLRLSSRNELGRRARQYAEVTFDRRRCTQTYLDLLS